VTFDIWPPPAPVGFMTFSLAMGTTWKNLFVVVFAPSIFLDYESILFKCNLNHLQPLHDLLSSIFVVLARHVSPM